MLRFCNKDQIVTKLAFSGTYSSQKWWFLPVNPPFGFTNLANPVLTPPLTFVFGNFSNILWTINWFFRIKNNTFGN